MKKKLLLILAAWALTALAAPAQALNPEDQQLLSEGPACVRVMPDLAQWSIDFSYTSPAAPNEPLRPKHVVITKAAALRHVERVYESGLKGDLWRTGYMEVESRSNQPRLLTRVVAGDGVADFPELEWVSAKNFVGVRTEGDRKCLVFQEERFTEFHGSLGMAVALVDAEKRLPVGYRFLNEIRRYTILPAPPAKLTMPAEFAAAGKAMLDHIEKTTPHLSAP
ncbi:MAG: hypothetical protein ACFUZC_03625 [Chthoniobacteraceae bacterium]